MPRQSGACVACRKIVWWRHPRITPMPHCATCGARLRAPGSRAYALLDFDTFARTRVASIAGALRSGRSRHPAIDAAVAGNTARWARELAHVAGRLYPHLRFEFDTDARGRVLEEYRV